MAVLQDIQSLMDKAEATPFGPACADLWFAAAAAAHTVDRELELECYLYYLRALNFGGITTDVVATFSKLQHWRRTRPQDFDDNREFLYLWSYKYVLRVLIEDPQYPKELVERFLTDMKADYEAYAGPSRAVASRAMKAAFSFGDLDGYLRHYQDWKTLPEGPLDDCPICAPEKELRHLVEVEHDMQAARELGEKALAAANLHHCNQQPSSLKTLMLIPWLYCGEDATALQAHRDTFALHTNRTQFFNNAPYRLGYLALSSQPGLQQPNDSEAYYSALGRLSHGVDLLGESMRQVAFAHTPQLLMEFFMAGKLLLQTFPAAFAGSPLHFKLPEIDRPALRMEGIATPTIGTAIAWFEQACLALAQAFDLRIGQQCCFHRERLQELAAPHWLDGDLPVALLGQTWPVGGFMPLAAEGHDTEQQYAAHVATLAATAAWRTMPLTELIYNAATYPDAQTMFLRIASERIIHNPQLTGATPPQWVTEKYRATWDHARGLTAMFGGNLTPAKVEKLPQDPLYLRVYQMQTALAAGDAAGAIALAQDYFQDSCGEPVGATLDLWSLLSKAYVLIGEQDKAAKYASWAYTVAGITGSTSAFAYATLNLSMVTREINRPYLAAMHTESVIEQMALFPKARPRPVVYVWAGFAHLKLGQHTEAINRFGDAGDFYLEINEPLLAAQSYGLAARSAGNSFAFNLANYYNLMAIDLVHEVLSHQPATDWPLLADDANRVITAANPVVAQLLNYDDRSLQRQYLSLTSMEYPERLPVHPRQLVLCDGTPKLTMLLAALLMQQCAFYAQMNHHPGAEKNALSQIHVDELRQLITAPGFNPDLSEHQALLAFQAFVGALEQTDFAPLPATSLAAAYNPFGMAAR